MPRIFALALLLFVFASPCLAAESAPLAEISRKWVDEGMDAIDKFAAQCGQNADCNQEVGKRYSALCDALTKKIGAMCAQRAGANARACQEDLAALLEANTNARMAAGKLQRYLYPNLSDDELLQRIFLSDMALLGAYVDALAAMLEK